MFRSYFPLRIAQYLVLVTFGIGGLLLGDNIGPLSGTVFDWDVMMDPEFSRAIKRYHGIVVGACATLPMLIVGRPFKINVLPVLATALVLASVFYLLPFLRNGELLSIHPYVWLPQLAAPFIAGSSMSFGAMFLFQELWSKVRGDQKP